MVGSEEFEIAGRSGVESRTGGRQVVKLGFSAERCTGCGLCEIVCSVSKCSEVRPSSAAIHVDWFCNGKEVRVQGRYCDLCLRCVKACLYKALTYSGSSLELDESCCDGCGGCVRDCPQRVMSIFNRLPVFCDLCKGNPACVEVCPFDALFLEKQGGESV